MLIEVGFALITADCGYAVANQVPSPESFVSFVINEVQMLEPQRTQRYTKDVMAL